ncbi:MAG: TIM barrel protein [Thermodesulfobacteriota bacterium]
METPALACPNFIPNPRALRDFASAHGFGGIEWSITPENRPQNGSDRKDLEKALAGLFPLEVRFHAALPRTDPGHADPETARQAMTVFQEVCRLAAGLGGRYLTIHLGLGRNSTNNLSWDRTIGALEDLAGFSAGLGLRLCLENLAWGWTSRPNVFEKFVRRAGLLVTLDIGHARVSPSVASFEYDLKDFTRPHPDKVVGAHVYHVEEGDRHLPPPSAADLEDRLDLLRRLPRCDWWLLELREEAPLLKTLEVVRQYLRLRNGAGEPYSLTRP